MLLESEMLNLTSTTSVPLGQRLVLVIELGLLLVGVMGVVGADHHYDQGLFSKEGQYYKCTPTL